MGEKPVALQGVLDAAEFAALDLGQLRTDLVLNRVQRRVDDVARCLGAKFLEQAQVAGQGLAQCVASLDENLAHVQNRVFAAHRGVTSVSDLAALKVCPPSG